MGFLVVVLASVVADLIGLFIRFILAKGGVI